MTARDERITAYESALRTKEDNSQLLLQLSAQVREMREALEHYACPADCKMERLKDGSCILALEGTCGNIARAALSATPSAGTIREGEAMSQDERDLLEWLSSEDFSQKRAWPDWRTAPADKAIEHIRDSSPTSPLPDGQTESTPTLAHDYLSTACLHGLHARCRQTCKFCGIACKCACHTSPLPDGQGGAESGEDRGLAGKILDEAWPEFGGDQAGADFWDAFSHAVHFTLAQLASTSPVTDAALAMREEAAKILDQRAIDCRQAADGLDQRVARDSRDSIDLECMAMRARHSADEFDRTAARIRALRLPPAGE